MAELLEDGDIYFLYRPRVEEEHVDSLEEVQRLLVVMHPWHGRHLRLLVVGRKRMPEIDEHDRFWAFVDAVVDRPEQLHEALQAREYRTRTRGRREQPPARPAAEGAYVIARHDDHTHLAYELELPTRPGEAQHELGIEPEASYIVTVKNPQAPSPPGVGLRGSQKVKLPAALQGKFHNRRFAPLDPPDFLDHPGTEMVLIGAAHDASEELRIDLDAEVERAERSTIFGDLRIGRRERPVAPLFTGEWA
ncbi:hypothetical protein EV384_4104 [Micromonospora kangleipakensis]|uniref:Uncharacterized protein n=1 Tax=Micromonospora kangleipakensis TaxID=1077942 RepID=A0A4Q8BEB5_9ACTN|nr:hypothetical protein [Micromonospora kangleipakensis]RZU75553.1 hypothetical protein EV384_4104 [Micromonospora kangleipakensis]